MFFIPIKDKHKHYHDNKVNSPNSIFKCFLVNSRNFQELLLIILSKLNGMTQIMSVSFSKDGPNVIYVQDSYWSVSV